MQYKTEIVNRFAKTAGLMAVLALASGVPALAGPADDTLNVAMARETDFVDRIHTNSRESSLLSSLLYDTLLYVEPETSEIVGLLATSWSWVDELTLEFRLREGVTFHNGEPFNADDVVYTVEFVADPAKGRGQATDLLGSIVLLALGIFAGGILHVRVLLAGLALDFAQIFLSAGLDLFPVLTRGIANARRVVLDLGGGDFFGAIGWWRIGHSHSP